MRVGGSHAGRRNAQRLRKQMTPPEIALWLALRGNAVGLRFRRQHAAGDYVLDFYCAPARLAIEVDGEAHARGDRPARDGVRDAWLGAQGMGVLRYPATEVLSNLDGICRQIFEIAVIRRERYASGSCPPPPTASGCHLPLAGEE